MCGYLLNGQTTAPYIGEPFDDVPVLGRRINRFVTMKVAVIAVEPNDFDVLSRERSSDGGFARIRYEGAHAEAFTNKASYSLQCAAKCSCWCARI